MRRVPVGRRRGALLRFALPDGRPATLLLGEASTVLSIDDALVSSWDLAGRPYALVRETGTYRRGLDGGLLWKREATADGPAPAPAALGRGGRAGRRGRPPGRRGGAGAPVSPAVAGRGRARRDLVGSEDSAVDGSPEDSAVTAEAVRRLRAIAAMDAAALREDAARFLAASGPVGILPPDQYLSLVVRVTEGCSWNACTFCSLYRDVPFRCEAPRRARRPRRGPARVLRPLDRPAPLRLPRRRQRPLPRPRPPPPARRGRGRAASRARRSSPSSTRGRASGRTPAEWRDYARPRPEARLRRASRRATRASSPGSRSPARRRTRWTSSGALHEAGIAAGVIVLLGAGGERFAEAHAARTAEALTAMRLGPDDLVYFSEYVDDPALAYGAARGRRRGPAAALPGALRRAASRDRRRRPARAGRPARRATRPTTSGSSCIDVLDRIRRGGIVADPVDSGEPP